jgi:adenylate cyclase class 2
MVAVGVLEVEAKLRVSDVAGLRRRLKEAGAKKAQAQEQTDTFFAHPVRDFAATDEALRVRRAGGVIELTYKGPRQGGTVKTRQEETLVVGGDPTPLLTALGFRVAAKLVKRREGHELEGAFVSLDRISGLGDFVEVEVVSTNAKAAEKKVERLVSALGLEGPRLRESYLELALAAGAAGATRL